METKSPHLCKKIVHKGCPCRARLENKKAKEAKDVQNP